MIVDEVTTLTGPGEMIDVIVTERGIAINPIRTDLIAAVQGSKLPIRPLHDIKNDIEKISAASHPPKAWRQPSRS